MSRRCTGVTKDGNRCRRKVARGRCGTCKGAGGQVATGLPPSPGSAADPLAGWGVPSAFRRDLYPVPAYAVVVDRESEEVEGTQVPLDATPMLARLDASAIADAYRELNGESLDGLYDWLRTGPGRDHDPDGAERVKALDDWRADHDDGDHELEVRLDAENASMWLLANRADLDARTRGWLTDLARFYGRDPADAGR